ncbi:MAG: hypothetical protein N2Z20_01520 [Elusimicrobiales bacterium]|nr:hypothetical protein [Elusimicrobiales bacterium]
MFSILILFSIFLKSNEIEIFKNAMTINIGASRGIFGHFGDFEDGFEGNFAFGASYMKEYDEFISFGISFSETFYFKHDTGIKIKFFSLTPLIFLKPTLKKDEYLYLGMGLYHWTSPKSKMYSSTSDDEFGFKIGYSKFIKLLNNLKFGLGCEFSYIIGVKGKNFNLGNINIIFPYLTLRYDFK